MTTHTTVHPTAPGTAARPVHRRLLSRRAALAALGLGTATALTACSSDGEGTSSSTVEY